MGCGVVWCGVVWCGVVWCGVMRRSVLSFSIVAPAILGGKSSSAFLSLHQPHTTAGQMQEPRGIVRGGSQRCLHDGAGRCKQQTNPGSLFSALFYHTRSSLSFLSL